MAFDIGNVVSPQVAAALIRRGENRGRGGGITRRDPIRRTQTTNTEDRDQAMFDRITLQEQAQAEAAAAGQRREAFDRERFEAGLSEKEKERELDVAKAIHGSRSSEANAASKARDKVTQIINSIGKAMRGLSAVTEDGKPDMNARKGSQMQIDALMQQIRNSGIPQSEIEQMEATLRSRLPSSPAARSGGIQRGPALNGLPVGVKDNGDGTVTLPNGKTLPLNKVRENAGLPPVAGFDREAPQEQPAGAPGAGAPGATGEAGMEGPPTTEPEAPRKLQWGDLIPAHGPFGESYASPNKAGVKYEDWLARYPVPDGIDPRRWRSLLHRMFVDGGWPGAAARFSKKEEPEVRDAFRKAFSGNPSGNDRNTPKVEGGLAATIGTPTRTP